MECHDVRLLFAFAQRACESLDAAERDAIQAHLAQCSECAAVTQLERRFDQSMSLLMADVPIPGELKGKILTRLATDRPYAPWKLLIKGTLAAAVLALTAWGYAAWKDRPLPVVLFSDVTDFRDSGRVWEPDKVESYFRERGLRIRFPSAMNHQALNHVEIVEFTGQRVAKLNFGDRNGSTAYVLILPHKQFDTKDLPAHDFRAASSLLIERDNDSQFTYLIYYEGELSPLRRVAQQ